MPRLYDRVRTRLLGTHPRRVATLAVIPADFTVLVGRAVIHPEVPVTTKLELGAAALYLAGGMDFLPEVLFGAAGWLDDGLIALEAVHRLLNRTNGDLIDSLWSGELEDLRRIQGGVVRTRFAVRTLVVLPVRRWLAGRIPRALARRMIPI